MLNEQAAIRVVKLPRKMAQLAAAIGVSLSLILAMPMAAQNSSAHTDATGPGPKAFDVASIHEHDSSDHNMSWRSIPGGFTAVNLSLRGMLSSAYNVKLDLISGGPGWMDNKGFDVEAKVLPGDNGAPVKLEEDQQRALLKALLVERFHVQAHVETKVLPVYELVVAKGGFKVQPDKPTPPSPAEKPGENKDGGSMMTNDRHMEVKRYELHAFAQQLGYTVQRTVLDRTGIKGQYTFKLDWAPEGQAGNEEASSGAEPHPPVFTALQDQLGLKLVPSKAPVDTLVVDHAELPTAN